MKLMLILSLMTLLSSPVFAATAIRLSCSLRKNMTISRFHYQLSTMKWDDKFQVASGIKKTKTLANIPYTVTHFENGDSLVEFPIKHRYYMFYNNNDVPDRCYLERSYSYTATELPRVN